MENLLDEENIDEADRVVVSDNLRWLREEQVLSETDQREVWQRIKGAAGAALKSPRVSAVVDGVVSAAIRHQLGIRLMRTTAGRPATGKVSGALPGRVS